MKMERRNRFHRSVGLDPNLDRESDAIVRSLSWLDPNTHHRAAMHQARLSLANVVSYYERAGGDVCVGELVMLKLVYLYKLAEVDEDEYRRGRLAQAIINARERYADAVRNDVSLAVFSETGY